MRSNDDPTSLSLAELSEALRAREISSADVTRRCLERIARLDPALHAFIAVTGDAALAAARTADGEIADGRHRGPLHGVPIALKDLIDVAGAPTTAGSALFADRVPAEDAEVVRRLRGAGAVLLGKLNLHEHAYGASGVIGHFPAARNPRSADHIAGGSSSGSAAAVAARMCFAALGSDTSGSIRIPAAFSGIVGFKPSYGRVSVRGVQPLAASYDHLGPMARSVGDAVLLYEAIAGYDPLDIFARDLPDPASRSAVPLPRVAVAGKPFFDDLDPEVALVIDAALQTIAPVAASMRDAAVPVPIDDDRTVFLAESYAFHRAHVAEKPELYQPETLRRIRNGATVSAADYIERLRDLQRLRRRSGELFAGADVIVSPTVAVPAPTFAEIETHPEGLRPREIRFMRNTRPFNVLGLPTLSIPCGQTTSGLPVGLQITGPDGADLSVLRTGEIFERALAENSATNGRAG